MWDDRSDVGCWVWDAQNVVVSHDLHRLMEFMGVPNLKVRVASLVSLFGRGYVLFVYFFNS